ncbi:MAG: hypothetical protein ABIB71_07430 [Candidatus Woesearchaeota archaeon]
MAEKSKNLVGLKQTNEIEWRMLQNLDHCFLESLDHIGDLTEEERQKLRETLLMLLKDTRNHYGSICELMEKVCKSGEDNY